MTERSLQITFRKGHAFAAYLYLSHAPGERTARTVASDDGLLVVDYAADGQPIGIEITAPDALSRERLNATLERLGEPPLPEPEFRPLTAA